MIVLSHTCIFSVFFREQQDIGDLRNSVCLWFRSILRRKPLLPTTAGGLDCKFGCLCFLKRRILSPGIPAMLRRVKMYCSRWLVLFGDLPFKYGNRGLQSFYQCFELLEQGTLKRKCFNPSEDVENRTGTEFSSLYREIVLF